MFDAAISVDELDARGVCEFLREQRTAQLRADANTVAAVSHWCDLHGCVNCADGQLLNPHLPGSERAKVFGADDNPEVLEFCVAEVAAVLGMHPNGAVELVADVQDLRFRHPLLLRRVMGLSVPLWKARQVVRRTRHLSRELAQLVDARTVDPIAALAWGRFLKILDAAVIAVDPELAEQLHKAAELGRFASMGRPDESGVGLRSFTARTRISEVVWFDGMCGRIAAMLKQLGDSDSLDLRRAKAFGLLGHPVKVLQLFADYQAAVDEGRIPAGDKLDPFDDTPSGATGNVGDPYDETPATSGGELDLFGSAGEPAGPEADAPASADDTGCDPASDRVSESDVHPSQNDADASGDPLAGGEDADVACPACAGAGTLDPRVAGDPTPFVKLATGLDKLNWAELLPKVSFYVHGTAADFRNPGACPASGGSGVVRVEGLGPITVEQARDFFGHDTHRVRVKPVIDTTDVKAVDAYETPDWMAEIVHLLSPGDVFPYATHVGRGVDLDHLEEYLDPAHGGPPGQTHPENLGPMVRFHHRIKTHGRWRMRVVKPGVQVWRTPQGFYFQTDRRGTHPLTDEAGQSLWDACADNAETSGTGKIRTEDIPRIATDATDASHAAATVAPARAGPDPSTRPASRAPVGPSAMELEFFTILEQYEYELAPD